MLNFMDVCKVCKRVRKDNKLTQKQVAQQIGYGVKTISAFENGRVNNALILLWYIDHGLMEYIKGGENNGTATHSNRNENIRHNGHVFSRF